MKLSSRLLGSLLFFLLKAIVSEDLVAERRPFLQDSLGTNGRPWCKPAHFILLKDTVKHGRQAIMLRLVVIVTCISAI